MFFESNNWMLSLMNSWKRQIFIWILLIWVKIHRIPQCSQEKNQKIRWKNIEGVPFKKYQVSAKCWKQSTFRAWDKNKGSCINSVFRGFQKNHWVYLWDYLRYSAVSPKIKHNIEYSKNLCSERRFRIRWDWAI